MGLLYEELSYVVHGCIYDVHNELGTGFDEESYQLALEKRLEEKGIPFRSQEVRYVEHREGRIHKFVLDLIIDDKIILELKAIETDFHSENTFQLLSYLKCWKKELGVLVNFGLPKAATKRILFTEKEYTVIENYNYIKNLITPDIRQPLMEFRNALLNTVETHGLGYGTAVYRAIFLKELSFKNIEFIPEILVPVNYGGQHLKDLEVKYPIVNNQFICGIVALKEHIKLDVIKVQTYLKALNLPLGLLAHFGKEKLEIYGVAP